MTSPIPNTQLLNDFIDINLEGSITGTDAQGTGKNMVRARLGDSVTLKVKESSSVATKSTAQTFKSSDSSISSSVSGTEVDLKGKLLQVVKVSTTSGDSTTSQIPVDNTIPQITEGKQLLSVDITPKYNNSILEVSFSAYGTAGGAQNIQTALYDGSTSAVYASTTAVGAGASVNICWVTYLTSGSITTKTYSLRYGNNDAATTVYMNRAAAAQFFGGVETATLIIKEYAS